MDKVTNGFSDKDVEVNSREECHDGFLRIERVKLRYRKFAGDWSVVLDRELQIKSPAVGILLFDPIRDEVILVRQFRIGLLDGHVSPWTLELVAGMVGEGEQLVDVAIREAQEESNTTPSEIVHICDYHNSPGSSNEKITLYCGRADSEHAGGIFGLAEEHEDIEVVVLSYSELLAATKSGQISNAMTIIAVQWLQLNKQELLQRWSC